MDKAEKALSLCREYDRLLKDIAKNRTDISTGSDKCCRIVTYSGGPLGEGVSYDAVPDGGDTCLGEVFKGYDSDGNWEPVHHHYNEAESLEIIGDCEGCMLAYKAVQERKANRKKLGIVKRQIRAIGRSA